jgi:hypothetical protein
MEDMKNNGFNREDKLKEKNTYLLYIFLYYNIFTNKLDFLKQNEF